MLLLAVGEEVSEGFPRSFELFLRVILFFSLRLLLDVRLQPIILLITSPSLILFKAEVDGCLATLRRVAHRITVAGWSLWHLFDFEGKLLVKSIHKMIELVLNTLFDLDSLLERSLRCLT